MRCDGLLSTKMALKHKQKAVQEPVSESGSDSSASVSAAEQSDGSDSGIDDEFDVNEVSSDEPGSDSEDDSQNEDGSAASGSDSDDDSFPMRKKKKVTDTGSESFASAFNAIIGSKLKAYDRKDPILARNKRTLKQLESDKLEAKAKRLMRAEKKEGFDRQRIKNLLPSADEPEKVRDAIEKERRLKKVAQKGVVKLFNAVLATQVKTNQEISQEKVGLTKKEELVNEISKAKFLDLVKAAGQT